MKNIEERINEFMKYSKKALAVLLAISDIEKETLEDDNSVTEFFKEELRGQHALTNDQYHNCSDWSHCGNPHMDCVNCPLRNKPGKYTINGKGTFSSTTYKEGDGQFAGFDQYQFTC